MLIWLNNIKMCKEMNLNNCNPSRIYSYLINLFWKTLVWDFENIFYGKPKEITECK